MMMSAALATMLAAIAGIQEVERIVPQIGRRPDATVEAGVPQTGRIIPGVPQRNPDGSVPRVARRWRPAVTVTYGPTGQDVIAYPQQFNLPAPALGLVWRRLGNDALLYDYNQDTVVEIRWRWFG